MAASSCGAGPASRLGGRATHADLPGVAFNTSTRRWAGHSSDGTRSIVSQVRTGRNSFRFTEVWMLPGGRLETIGEGRYDPATGRNWYSYSKPRGEVMVQTEEDRGRDTTVDTVMKSSVPFLSEGERITYTALP